jgi:AcrR family transcriptional regulator
MNEETPARRGRGRPRREEADSAIVTATVELLRTSSYDGVTLDAVGRAAGAAKTTLYRRWSSKADLVAQSLLSVLPPAELVEATTLRLSLTIIVQRMIDLLDGEFSDAIVGVINDPLASRESVSALLDRVSGRELLRTLHPDPVVADALIGAVWLRMVVRRERENETFARELVAAVL